VFRLFLILNLFFLNIYACKGGHDSCKLKATDSNTILTNGVSIPVSKHKRLVYSKSTPNAKILKHDPFLNLYLIEDKKGFKYPFVMNNRIPLGVASIDKKNIIEGKITKKQIGLNSFALFSEVVSYPSILTSSCCSLEGIVTPEGIIDKDYLSRFIKSKDIRYATVGIRVKEKKKYVEVTEVNPYFPNNPFKKGDCILEFNNKKISDASMLMKKILFSKIGSTNTIKIKRNNKILTLKVKSSLRHGGGYISDTFLEQKGIYFDDNLKVTRIEKKFKNYELKVGDKLLMVNRIKVKNRRELKSYISKYKDFSFLLLERNHFQFFVKIN
jgi:hypothetical protein